MSQAPTTPQITRTPTSNLNVPGAASPSASPSKTLTRPGSTSSLRRPVEHEDDLVPHSRSVSRRGSESDAGVGSTPAPAQPAYPQSTQPAQPAQLTRTPTMQQHQPAAPAATNSPGAPVSAAAHAGLVPLLPGQMQARAENAALTAPVDWWVESSSLDKCLDIDSTTGSRPITLLSTLRATSASPSSSARASPSTTSTSPAMCWPRNRRT